MGLFRKSGGGKLNNVYGRIVSLELTTKPFGEKTSDKYGESVYAVLRVLPEGATDEPIFEPLKIGKAEHYTLDADRPYWMETDQADVLHPSSQMGKLVASMVEVGVSPETFVESDDAQEIDFSALVNAEFCWTYKDDLELQEKFGKKKYTKADGTKGEANRRYLAVTAVRTLGGAAAIKGKAKAPAKVETAESVVGDTIAAILRESPGRRIMRSKLAAKVALKLGKGHALLKHAQELIGDEDFLSGCDAFTYNDDTQELRLAA